MIPAGVLEVGLIEDKRRVFDLRQLEQELVTLIEEFYGIVSFRRFGQGNMNIAVFACVDKRGDPVDLFWYKGFDEQGVSVNKDDRVFGVAEDRIAKGLDGRARQFAEQGVTFANEDGTGDRQSW